MANVVVFALSLLALAGRTYAFRATLPEAPLISGSGTSITVENSNAVTISRQGEIIEYVDNLNGTEFEHTFDTHDMHREFIISATGARQIKSDGAFFVKRGNKDLCGTGLFTTRSLECSKMSPNDADDIADRVTKYINEIYPQEELLRGFGIELEFVGREIPLDLKKLASYDMVEAYKMCFSNHTMSYKDWGWDEDVTVRPLRTREVRFFSDLGVGIDDDETIGEGFEVVSPSPPHVLAGRQGMRSLLEVLGVLKFMGIQAGPSSGLHVHVNVGSRKAPGTLLTYREVAYVWAAFAKYQFVIDEMLSPNRIQNTWAKPLFLGDCKKCEKVKNIFRNIHKYVTGTMNKSNHDLTDFCSAAFGSETVCGSIEPKERYYQLNLIPLKRYGTIEFRNQAATYDQERILHWTLFVVAFVEHFGNAGADEVKPFFNGGSSEDLENLAQTQKDATLEGLFHALKQKLNLISLEYFSGRKWEQNLPGCPATKTLTEMP